MTITLVGNGASINQKTNPTLWVGMLIVHIQHQNILDLLKKTQDYFICSFLIEFFYKYI